MPTLNSEAFLAPRLESIRRQTFTNWELVVVDSQSDDQTIPMIEAFAEQGGAVRIYQGPRDGIYTNINRSIEYAQGQYVYIATSDDTMAEDCLEKMVEALDRHNNCGLAHCCLRMLDAQGVAVEDDWWPVRSTFAQSSGNMLRQTHVRKAPYDGLLHMLGETVYISLTQLLTRRSLFERIGMFRSDWGSISDYYWDMRAGLAADTVHVGDTWASWRVHETQATASADIGQQRHTDKASAMITQALDDAKGDLSEAVLANLQAWRSEAEELRHFLAQVQTVGGRSKRWSYVMGELLQGSTAAKRYIRGKMMQNQSLPEHAPQVVDGWLRAIGIEPMERAEASGEVFTT